MAKFLKRYYFYFYINAEYLLEWTFYIYVVLPYCLLLQQMSLSSKPKKHQLVHYIPYQTHFFLTLS